MMNESIRVTRRPRQASLPTARTAAAIIATAGLALLAAACGGSPGIHPAASAQQNGALAVSRCMRSHGVPNFPDPTSSGLIDKAKVVPLTSSPQFQTAQRACQHLLPNTNPPRATHAEVPQALSLEVSP